MTRRVLGPSTMAIVAIALLPVGAGAAIAAPAVDPDDARLVMLLDASGSMAEPDASGAPRIDAARTALDAAIGALDDGARVGFRVFGATVVGQESAGACEDTQQVVPVGADNRSELAAAVDEYAPFGETPIGAGLLGAAGDLGDDGQRTILLVSDGLSNCEPDPCEVAASLQGAGIDLVVNVVGMNVGVDARTQLQCIADATGGTYYDATDTASLTTAVTQVATRASRPLTFSGTPIEGGDAPSDATTLDGGTWLDAVGEESRWYRIERQVPGSTIRLGALAVNPQDSTGSITLRLQTASEEQCAFESGTAVSGDDRGRLAIASITLAESDIPECMDEDLYLAVGGDAEFVDRPIELRLLEQLPFADADALPAPEPESDVDADGLGAATATVEGVVPGSSSADAPLLVGGEVYALDIVPGETQTFFVDLDWGQALAVGASFDGSALGYADLLMSMDVYDPYLAPVSRPYSETAIVPSNLDDLGIALPPVRALGSTTSCETGQCPSVAGRYLVIVRATERNDVQPGQIVPYTLGVEVAGTAGEGAPDYVDVPGSDAAGEPSARGEQSSSDSGVDAGIVVGALIGLLGVAAIVTGAVIAVRRRRSTTGGPDSHGASR